MSRIQLEPRESERSKSFYLTMTPATYLPSPTSTYHVCKYVNDFTIYTCSIYSVHVAPQGPCGEWGV